MDKPLVSVIVPVYNRKRLIIDALDSIHAQSHRPLEIIVVDDGSTDGTVDRINEWIRRHQADGPFHARLCCQHHQGGNAARNHGIAMANGTLIAFLDSDDLWFPQKLEKQLPLLSDKEVGAVYCGVETVALDSGERMMPTKRDYPYGWLLQALLVRDVTAPTSTYLIRRAALDSVGRFDQSLEARQDWDLWIRLAARYRIEVVGEPLVYYRQHSGPRTISDPYREVRAYRQIREKYASLLRMQPPHVKRAARSSYFKRMGRVHFHQGLSMPRALGYYLMAIAANPRDFDAWAAFAAPMIPRGLRQTIHRRWNQIFGRTALGIRSH